jgi:hypothetical protein
MASEVVKDLIWAAQNGMIATDFDSLIGNHATVGPLYYLIATVQVRS